MIKHGPNVGKKPSACKSDIFDKDKYITAFVSSSDVLSLMIIILLINVYVFRYFIYLYQSLTVIDIFSHIDGNLKTI